MSDEELRQRLEEIEKQSSVFMLWQQDVNKVLSKILEITDEIKRRLQENEDGDTMLQYQILELQGIVNSIPFDLADPELKLPVLKPRILSEAETLRLLVEDGKSIARFGDCEFEMIEGRQRWGYQSVDPLLSDRLREVVTSNMNKLLVGINPDFYENQLFKNGDAAMGIRAYMTPKVREEHARLLSSDRVYANALLFRNIHTDIGFNKLKQLWDGKECLFVEGENTGLGVGNDLFDNCKSIERIVCPAENCFSRYADILENARKYGEGKLIFTVLGPTASVLAYDLALEGYQTIDLGQVDLVYEAYVRKLASMDDLLLPDKYCTSDVIGEKRQISRISDPSYLSQILVRV